MVAFYVMLPTPCAVQVNNTSSRAITIAKNSRLDIIHEYEEEGCYAASTEYDYLAAGPPPSNPSSWFKKAMQLDVATLAAYCASPTLTSAESPATRISLSPEETHPGLTIASSSLLSAIGAHETTTPKGYTVYGITEEVRDQDRFSSR